MKHFLSTAFISTSLVLGASGVIYAASDQDAMETAPAAVKDAVKKAAGTHKITSFDKEDDNGHAVYEAAFKVDGIEHTVSIGESGDLIEEETEVKVADLPAAVSAAVLKAQPLAHVKEAAMVKKHGQSYYEVEAKVGKQKHEISIAPDGKLITDKAEADEKAKDGDKEEKGKKDKN